jgi:hypothetical protein
VATRVRPSCGQDGRTLHMISPSDKQKYFPREGLTRISEKQPVGQIS